MRVSDERLAILRRFAETDIESIDYTNGDELCDVFADLQDARAEIGRLTTSESQVDIRIDVNEDFDGIHLEDAIRDTPEGKAKDILTLIHHKWVTQIGHPEWSMIREEKS